MTEYTSSSQAYREFMSARERTAYWVQTVSPSDVELYSPSVPPSVLEGLIPSSPPSEADSASSTPPRMVLRYNDGRPDVPIPRPNGMSRPGPKRQQDSNVARSHTLSYNHNHNHARHDLDSRAPEEIRILPSYGDVPSGSSRPNHSRSKSLPRSSERMHEPEPELPPFISPAHLQSQSTYPPHSALSTHPISSPPQQVNFVQPPHPWPRQGHAKHPPAIVYAPAHHSQHPSYSPPAMFHHPPQVGPNGMIYSHSAPVPGQYPPAYPTPYPSVGSQRHTSSARDVRMTEAHDRARTLGHSSRRHNVESAESLGSEKSGSTYYVLPSHGQKVHVINPSPEQSIITATSTTKAPSSPYGYGNGKRPFFQRLFNFHVFSSAGSARSSPSSGRKLSRRHSIGASAQQRVGHGR